MRQGKSREHLPSLPRSTEKPLRVQAMVDPHRLLLSEIRHFLPHETGFRSNCLCDVLQIWCKPPAESSLIPTATSCWVALGAETHSGGSSRQGRSTVPSVDSSSPGASHGFISTHEASEGEEAWEPCDL
ncbi:hypothetical protein CgunFtcFv8_001180 [Champsocephalus gunnari]|uniref:Uncharacterized protein n=1 Tax=Champsocephalus gunnari TaxID=52237 RepID=A0AAN8DJR8_CHAGU|nr:hypothetical protein CgunFtcFv8_001180 [Champsocephalus gunnari]